jgi:hypothetical protein
MMKNKFFSPKKISDKFSGARKSENNNIFLVLKSEDY